MTDNINPNHYKQYTYECIDIVEKLPFCLGNCIKYIWRAGDKYNTKEDYTKALWYLNKAESNGEYTKGVTQELATIADESTGIKQRMFIALYRNHYHQLRKLLQQEIE